jgi:hypothetical protein
MMLEHLYNLSGAQLATLICVSFALFRSVSAYPYWRYLLLAGDDEK